MPGSPRIFISAGEASGDMHAAALVSALAGLAPGLEASGVGGPAMAAAGVELIHSAEELTLVGFSEVLPKLRVIWRALGEIKRHLRQTRPDLVILVDFPDFNFRVGRAAKRLGLKVLYYISPQMWAWRRGRARAMARFVDRLAVVFPFEPGFLDQAAPELPVSFVGHPLLDQDWRRDEGQVLPVPEGAEVVGLLPGSRRTEINHILPLLLAAARRLQRQRPGLRFVLPLAPGLARSVLEPHLPGAPPGLSVVAGRSWQVMRRARLLLVASGTATLQAALAGAPMVVVYKTGRLNYHLARLLVKVDFIAMPNLVAGRQVVPELIQGEAEPEALAQKALELLDEGPARQEMIAGLALVRERLGGPGASRRAAELALAMMESSAV